MSNQILTDALTLPEAKGREAFVAKLVGSGMDLQQVRAALAAVDSDIARNEANAKANAGRASADRLASLRAVQRRVNGYGTR